MYIFRYSVVVVVIVVVGLRLVVRLCREAPHPARVHHSREITRDHEPASLLPNSPFRGRCRSSTTHQPVNSDTLHIFDSEQPRLVFSVVSVYEETINLVQVFLNRFASCLRAGS